MKVPSVPPNAQHADSGSASTDEDNAGQCHHADLHTAELLPTTSLDHGSWAHFQNLETC
jgi:hypothetical protein